MKKVSITTANGSKVELPLFDPVVASHFNNSATLSQMLVDQVNSGMYEKLFKGKDLTFVDIGANIGLVSVYASTVCKRILAVEPDPETFVVLKAVTNGLTNIEPINFALSSKDGGVEFYRNNENPTASSIVNKFGDKITVQGLTLSSILRIHQLERVDVVKVDVEGSEQEALRLEELEQVKDIVDCFYVETHPCPNTTYQHKLGCLCKRFASCGYSKMSIDGMAITASK